MKLVGVQLDIVWEDKPATFARVRRLLDASAPEAGSLVVLPEMFSTGFSMNVEAIHEGAERPAERFLEALARQYGIYALGGVVNVGPDGRGLNQAVAFSPQGELLVRYDKIHPFTMGEESKHYTGGREVRTFKWGGLTVCPLVCYDLRFPETFRGALRHGPELFVVIANWPSYREHHWTTLLAARAIENLAYVIGVNRMGTDPKHPYSGRSLIIDPKGKALADAGTVEGVITADVDQAAVRTWRSEFPAFSDIKSTTVP
jgi:predicted amidohydrolase